MTDRDVIARVHDWLALDDLEERCRRTGDIRALVALAERLTREAELLDKILVCHRMGNPLSNNLLDDIAADRDALRARAEGGKEGGDE